VSPRERDAAPDPAPDPDADLSSSTADDWQSRLGEVMEARRLSGGELARRAGFTSQYINSLRSGGRGARLPFDTARKLAHALGVSVDWLTKGDGPRERLSDVYVVGASATNSTSRAPVTTSTTRAPGPLDLYPSRAEAIALLAAYVAPEVIEALRAAVPDDGGDPGRDYWIRYAKDLARDLRRIKDDPDLNAKDAPPKSAYVPVKKKG
jgi:transcriptional regulator with XRE-family HTH domain